MSFSSIPSNRTTKLSNTETTHLQDKTTISLLPNDVIGRISSFVNCQDAQTLSFVSKNISIVTVGQRYTDIFNDLRSFIHQLRLKLVDESKIKILEKIKSTLRKDSATIITSIDSYHMGDPLPAKRLKLTDLKRYIFWVKQEIIRELMTLSGEEIDTFQDIPLPSFFENIWEALELYAEFEEEMVNPDPMRHRLILTSIAKDLAIAGEVDKAFEVANSITDDQFWRQEAFGNISRALAKRGSFNRVFEAANLASVKNKGFWVLWRDLAQILAEKGEFDLAMQAANIFPNDSIHYGAALLHISKSHAKAGDFEVATKIASIIPVRDGYYEQHNALILLGICESLATSGKEDLVAQIIERINVPIDGSSLYIEVIISYLIENEESDKAIQMVNNLKLDKMHQGLLDALIKSLIEGKKFNEALKMVNNLDWEYSRNGHLQNIVKGLWKDEKHDHAREAFNIITTPQMRKPLLEEIPELQENQRV